MGDAIGERDAALLLDILLAARDAADFLVGFDEAAFMVSRLHQNERAEIRESQTEGTPFEQIRVLAMAYPEAAEDFPWGETAIKVRGKMFVVMQQSETGFVATVKLPVSRYFALEYPFAKPTGYGLGKSGWVGASFGPGDDVPVDVLRAWVDESYRAVAPRKVVAALSVRKEGLLFEKKAKNFCKF